MTEQGRLHEALRDKIVPAIGAGLTAEYLIKETAKLAEDYAETRARETRGTVTMSPVEIKGRLAAIRGDLEALRPRGGRS